MHLKRIIVDGFKSYATRTVIGEFDPTFNAITGLNGSGKSNILDSICFVLGISNLSQVRAANLQDLVYKQGQAGVTKASVTLLFDNGDKAAGPVGYEDYDEISVTREIVIGGRNKYLINGHTAQLSRVQNLFHSVQLNVNNPHFLIMQGKITKVLNMKAPEILAMVEEAAGTRMYEMKKATAMKTIEKKQKKLEEIDGILNTEIIPRLEKLRKERADYMRWSSQNTECQRLGRLVTAYDFVQAESRRDGFSEKVEAHRQKMRDAKDDITELQGELAEMAAKIQDLLSEKAAHEDDDFKQLERDAGELSKVLVKLDSQRQHKADAVQQEENALAKLHKHIADMQTALTAKAAEQQQLAKAVADSGKAHEALEAKLANLQKQHQAACAGVAAGGDGEGTLTEQLMAAKAEKTAKETTRQQVQMQVKHLEKSLGAKRREAKSADREYQRLEKQRADAAATVTKYADQLIDMAFDDKAEAELAERVDTLDAELRTLDHEIEDLSAPLAAMNFQYKAPEKNFDHSRVKGLVGRLVSVKDPQSDALALEIAAGGRLYQVVVDTEDTGKKLLERGQLQRRVTIIPLNKIRHDTPEARVLRKVQQVSDSKAHLALSLVGFDGDVQAAMEYVFGRTLVCEDMETAKRCTFHPEIRMQSVTRDGDVFDPSGTLTGGSKPKSSGVLAAVTRLVDVEKRRAELAAELAALQEKLGAMQKNSAKAAKVQEKHDEAAHALKLLEESLRSSPHYSIVQEVKDGEEELERLQNELSSLDDGIRDLAERIRTIEKEMADFQKGQKTRIKDLEKGIAAAKEALAHGVVAKQQAQQSQDEAVMEHEEMSAELETMAAQVKEQEKAVSAAAGELSAFDGEVRGQKDAFTALQGELDLRRQAMKENDAQCKKLQSAREKVAARIEERELALKKLDHTLARMAKDSADAEHFVQDLIQRHQWIASERQFFGRRGTDFDFDAVDMADAKRRLADLEQERQTLAKTVNKKVMTMFEQAEQEYRDVSAKKRIVERDRQKIEETIVQLDVKKRETLEATFTSVNRDFGSIFSTLLPGAMSRLEPPAGQTIMDGLEVRVAFGDVWKESLSELSGGQRSLIALSLVLAMLLYKPAPMYILDEVDAALDPSHTQNIGRMLRQHFTNSQFIVVSLKDGMFQNANVIFRTKLVNGKSTVARTVAGHSDRSENDENFAAVGAAGGKGAGRRRGGVMRDLN